MYPFDGNKNQCHAIYPTVLQLRALCVSFTFFRYTSTKCSIMLKRHGHNKSFTPFLFLPNTIDRTKSFRQPAKYTSVCDNRMIQLWIIRFLLLRWLLFILSFNRTLFLPLKCIDSLSFSQSYYFSVFLFRIVRSFSLVHSYSAFQFQSLHKRLHLQHPIIWIRLQCIRTIEMHNKPLIWYSWFNCLLPLRWVLPLRFVRLFLFFMLYWIWSLIDMALDRIFRRFDWVHTKRSVDNV